MSPMTLFVGSPLYVLYLRALGARIGRGVTILSTQCAGVQRPLTIGSGTLIRDSHVLFPGTVGPAGTIRTGRVHTLGRNVRRRRGSGALDIETAIADGGQLGPLLVVAPRASRPGSRLTAGTDRQLFL